MKTQIIFGIINVNSIFINCVRLHEFIINVFFRTQRREDLFVKEMIIRIISNIALKGQGLHIAQGIALGFVVNSYFSP